ncbi:unnamed protein product [Rotaria sp. Silwood1]|nr:unnamed protein product [Rotaria sp. Silwood1]
MTVIYSLSINYRTNTYEPIIILCWILFFASGMLVTQRYYPTGIINIIVMCIIAVFITVEIIIITSQPSKHIIQIPFTVIPIVTCLTNVILNAIIVIFSFKLSSLIMKNTKSNEPE